MIRLDVTAAHEGVSTTVYVAALIPELTGFNLKKMLKNGDIRLNGSRVKKDFELDAGDVVEVYMPPGVKRVFDLDICYEDSNIIVINKEPGIPLSPDGEAGMDLTSVVARHMTRQNEYLEDTGNIPFACYKLDTHTGGLSLFAKNADIFDILREAFHQRRIRRVFNALIEGCPDSSELELRHFYSKYDEYTYQVSDSKIKNSVPIYTRVRLLNPNAGFSLVEVEPVTQCADQERAHLGAAGYPVLGDEVYGNLKLNKKLGLKYQALWATELEFKTGSGNLLEYLNGTRVIAAKVVFPLINM